jgi:drug/metabolite transporter (DMT)-like permease
MSAVSDQAAASPSESLPLSTPLRAYAILGAGVLVVSTAAIMIRYAHADGVPSLAIAAWRLALAALLLLPLVLARSAAELRGLGRTQWLLALASGAFLGAHFASWIISLEYTSVASSVALVTTNPIWIALFSWLILRERLSLRLSMAIALALGGSAAIFLADEAGGPATQPMLGNTLAVIGSLTVCGYLLIGRKLRGGMNLLPYITIVYGCAALCLMAAALAAGVKLSGYSPFAWAMLAGLALGPQLLGHSAVNYALRHLSATVIAVAVLGEPIGSTLFAWLFFGETVGLAKLVGMGLLLGGIFLAATAKAR